MSPEKLLGEAHLHLQVAEGLLSRDPSLAAREAWTAAALLANTMAVYLWGVSVDTSNARVVMHVKDRVARLLEENGYHVEARILRQAYGSTLSLYINLYEQGDTPETVRAVIGEIEKIRGVVVRILRGEVNLKR